MDKQEFEKLVSAKKEAGKEILVLWRTQADRDSFSDPSDSDEEGYVEKHILISGVIIHEGKDSRGEVYGQPSDVKISHALSVVKRDYVQVKSIVDVHYNAFVAFKIDTLLSSSISMERAWRFYYFYYYDGPMVAYTDDD